MTLEPVLAIEEQLRGQNRKKKALPIDRNVPSGKVSHVDTLDALIDKLYDIKRELIKQDQLWGKDKVKVESFRNLQRQKDQVVFSIQKELSKVDKVRVESVRARLYEDLRILIG